MKTAIIAYVPVVHSGYIKLFKKYPNTLFVLDSFFLSEFPAIERDIRALSPSEAVKAVSALGILKEVSLISKKRLNQVNTDDNFSRVILPDEDIMRVFAGKYLAHPKIIFENIFLRWDKMKAAIEVEPSPNKKISKEKFDREIMSRAEGQAEKSSDWWRHVGAVLVKGRDILFEKYNKHVSSEHNRDFEGDPRSNFVAGERIDLSTAFHAEAAIISEAAKAGQSVKGASIYVTTFPCPYCAKLIVASGIKKVFYKEGYSILDAENLFKASGVELIKVE